MFALKESFFFFFKDEMRASQQSASIKEGESLRKVPRTTKHDLLKRNMRPWRLRRVIRVQQRVKELSDRRILTELTPVLCR